MENNKELDRLYKIVTSKLNETEKEALVDLVELEINIERDCNQ